MSGHRVRSRLFLRTITFGACVGGIVLTAGLAAGATWRGNRTTPRLTEIVAIDATGEFLWPFGQEDVAGDGSAFLPPEQSIDVRTAYAATDANRFWVRTYVSAANAVGEDVTVFVFIDSDGSRTTGGSAASQVIHDLFVTDPSLGGYEYVMALHGNGTDPDFWEWRQQQAEFVTLDLPASSFASEGGVDTDPILLNGVPHGYVQGTVRLADVDLTTVCSASLFFRSVNDAPGEVGGDLEVGTVVACVPPDVNSDGIPDVIVPAGGCTVDSQCPGEGLCVNGQCVLVRPCVGDSDCGQDRVCTADGRCVPRPITTGCTSSDACDGLLCVEGQCVPCTPGGAQCGAGWRCGPDGLCYEGVPTGAGGTGGTGGTVEDGGLVLEPDELVEGGACHCTTRGGAGWGTGIWLLLAASGFWGVRRRGARRGRKQEEVGS